MAAVDYFLKIDGIEGETNDPDHPGEIELVSWSWGEAQMGTHAAGGGGGAGKVNMQDFHFTMDLNKASPRLMLACAKGEHIKKAVLTCRKAGGKQEKYFTVTMSDLLVSSYQTGSHGRSELVPQDQITLNFTKIEFEYKPQKRDGSLGGPVKAGWDVKTNRAA